MNADKYPDMLKKRMDGSNIMIGTFLITGIVFWIVLGSLSSLILCMFFLAVSIFSKVKLCRSLKRDGFSWKRYKVIDYTYLTRHNRQPSGFVVLSCNDNEPIRRYHFGLSRKLETPQVGSLVEVCVPGNVKISEIGWVYYVSEYYGIRYDAQETEVR